MGAWIEIAFSFLFSSCVFVAPHDGCVDWNNDFDIYVEGMDSSETRSKLVKIEQENRNRRTPRWVRGLKFLLLNCWWFLFPSHPTMGAWIEINLCDKFIERFFRRTPRWVRGLKSFLQFVVLCDRIVAPHDGCVDWNSFGTFFVTFWCGRTPRWVRGLK